MALEFNMLKKYFKIYRVFLNNSISYEAQYRKDTIIKFIVNLLWVGMMFVTIEIIYAHTNSIIGWSKADVYLMTVLWIIADELYVTLFGSNLTNIPNKITEGELDIYLTKPANALFLISGKILQLRGFMRFLSQIPILIWLIWRFEFTVSFISIILCACLVLVAVWIDYSRVLIANTFSFWFYRIDNINQLIGNLSGLGKYPLSVWPKTVKIIFLTAIPVAFSGFVPVATLTGRWPWYGIAYAFLFAILLFFIAVKFWNFALKRYSSASS